MAGVEMAPASSFLPLGMACGSWPVSDCGLLPYPVLKAAARLGFRPRAVGTMQDLAELKKRFNGQDKISEAMARIRGGV
ncbi:MAG: hypothetical protein K9K66_04285 [Desulfarculaceae bacterium]|nr:hypothetical protein [Desulfarculaceae bacterium]MCF8073261.1 hypothetical protein [Desulfarculaceae bacterium]MCF8100857.1 hypothetical protein [Desulfarculaceae bacterium]